MKALRILSSAAGRILGMLGEVWTKMWTKNERDYEQMSENECRYLVSDKFPASHISRTWRYLMNERLNNAFFCSLP